MYLTSMVTFTLILTWMLYVSIQTISSVTYVNSTPGSDSINSLSVSWFIVNIWKKFCKVFFLNLKKKNIYLEGKHVIYYENR